MSDENPFDIEPPRFVFLCAFGVKKTHYGTRELGYTSSRVQCVCAMQQCGDYGTCGGPYMYELKRVGINDGKKQPE